MPGNSQAMASCKSRTRILVEKISNFKTYESNHLEKQRTKLWEVKWEEITSSLWLTQKVHIDVRMQKKPFQCISWETPWECTRANIKGRRANRHGKCQNWYFVLLQNWPTLRKQDDQPSRSPVLGRGSIFAIWNSYSDDLFFMFQCSGFWLQTTHWPHGSTSQASTLQTRLSLEASPSLMPWGFQARWEKRGEVQLQMWRKPESFHGRDW